MILVQYFITLISTVLISGVLGYMFISLLMRFTWSDNSIVYRLGRLFYDFFPLWIILGIFGEWVIITYVFFNRPLHHLDYVVNASKQLAQQPERIISLPAELKEVQDEMNQLREQSLNNARAAKEAEQRKNDLIVYLAHDLKTPLTSVIGYLTLLRDERCISEELQIKYTGVALDKAERLEELINEFFDITRFNLMNITLETERINISRMLEQITFEFNPVLAEKGLSWELFINPEVQILCDSNKLERVFDNLIRNAINYSYHGTEIQLTLQEEKAEKQVMLQIRNHGKTIPKEKLNHIFEQFYRMDTSRASNTGGAGLGLAIAKEIVELHRGTITVESENESICFTIKLPVD